jgi:hypothetical protein
MPSQNDYPETQPINLHGYPCHPIDEYLTWIRDYKFRFDSLVEAVAPEISGMEEPALAYYRQQLEEVRS